jgi:hypothetical protein
MISNSIFVSFTGINNLMFGNFELPQCLLRSKAKPKKFGGATLAISFGWHSISCRLCYSAKPEPGAGSVHATTSASARVGATDSA